MYSNINYCKNLDEIELNSELSYLFFIAEKSSQIYEELKEKEFTYYGAIFPSLIFNDKSYDDGFLVFEIEKSTLVDIISHDCTNFSKYSDLLQKRKTILAIVDGLSPTIESFLENIYEVIDTNCNIIGGGAGKLTLRQEPVIFSNNGIFQDSALIISCDFGIGIGIGVKHGWKKIEGNFIATHSNKNILHSIDYKSAFELYKSIVEKDSNKKFNETNFFEISKEYPFGIERISNEIVVRDPIAVIDGAIVLVGEIEQNAIISILKGEKPNLIKAANEAVKDAIKDSNKKVEDIKSIFAIDCISRLLYLEDEFDDEIKAIHKEIPNSTLFGILTLGEIANLNKEYIKFYNKTCVVGIG